MSKPYTSSHQLILSSLYCLSSIAHTYKVALSGNMSPPGLSHLSLAYRTVSSMDSYNRQYPIHSEIM